MTKVILSPGPAAAGTLVPVTSRPTPTPTATPIPTPTPVLPTPTLVGTLDSDGDGLPDDEERRIGTDRFNVDSDSDGSSDLQEIQRGTDPLNWDTDGDRLSDGTEISIGSNPLVLDTDADGLSDGDEVNIYGTNPLFQDTDLDGVIDGTDLFPLTDASITVSVLSFDDVSSSSADPFGGNGDPYFAVTVHGQQKTSQTFMDTLHVENVLPLVFPVPDDVRSVTVEVQAWDEDYGRPRSLRYF